MIYNPCQTAHPSGLSHGAVHRAKHQVKRPAADSALVRCFNRIMGFGVRSVYVTENVNVFISPSERQHASVLRQSNEPQTQHMLGDYHPDAGRLTGGEREKRTDKRSLSDDMQPDFKLEMCSFVLWTSECLAMCFVGSRSPLFFLPVSAGILIARVLVPNQKLPAF